METLLTDRAWMEPMLPEESNRELEDISFELTFWLKVMFNGQSNHRMPSRSRRIE
jgi:hypothetical protein